MPSQQGNNDLNSTKQQLNCSLTEEQIKLLSREELLNNLKWLFSLYVLFLNFIT
ncbi:hypothetical protein [Spiroplasma endosymbiont of Virgichneumon dumeticola]|uniref:hypothetical protein n=1 Tax=Spiroplasma endosymbiont of Virgichneumon dumeticola TaxID=3139323 RepID=UPI0035C8B659